LRGSGVDLSEGFNQTLHDLSKCRRPLFEIRLDPLDPLIERPDRGCRTLGGKLCSGEHRQRLSILLTCVSRSFSEDRRPDAVSIAGLLKRELCVTDLHQRVGKNARTPAQPVPMYIRIDRKHGQQIDAQTRCGNRVACLTAEDRYLGLISECQRPAAAVRVRLPSGEFPPDRNRLFCFGESFLVAPEIA
jgi:hypothetical protein